MKEKVTRAVEADKAARSVPGVSAILPDGAIVELVYRPAEQRTAFVVGHDGEWQLEPHVALSKGRRFVPYSPHNNLLRNGVVLFAAEPEEYETEAALVGAIRTFIHRYVDLSPLFEKLAAYYVLFSWLYDAFNEVPYLRVRGDYGSGKTRFLLAVGSLCYKPIFASGASTVSPLFRMLDTFRGTLVIDESDFRVSDERAEVVKILNNGNGRSFPVLRSEVNTKGEYNPRAYQVFGPKLIGTRGFFDDRALESRCLTEEMGDRPLRDDIPISLPDDFGREALALRNRLLLFRLRSRDRSAPDPALVDRAIEPRLSQIFVPLLSVIDDAVTRQDLVELARRYQRDLVADRGLDTEAQVLDVMLELLLTIEEPYLPVRDIAERFAERYGDDYQRKVTPRWIGGILKRKLRLQTERRHGSYVVPREAFPKLKRLAARYGIEANPTMLPDDSGATLGDVGRG